MSLKNASAFTVLMFALAGITVAAPAAAADEKEACLSAADQGQSLRDEGKYLSAHDEFVLCSRDVCPKLVQGQCADWLRQLDEATPTVVFVLKDSHGADILTAHVSADGDAVASGVDGKPVPLDPGPHDIRFERDAPTQSVSVHVVLRAGEKKREVSAVLPAVAEAPAEVPPEAPAPVPAPALTPAPPAREKPAESPSFWNGRSITAASLLGAGVVGVGVGVYFGLQSQSERNQAGTLRGEVGSRSGCPTPSTSALCQQLSDTVDSQNRDAVLNDAFYVVGGVLAAGAVATWFLWPTPHEEPTTGAVRLLPLVGPRVGGMGLGGAF
jgi:hypothetical protein